MKYLVTGGAGFIGSNIVDSLILNGHDVTVIDNECSNSNNVFYWNSKANNYKFDICDYDKVRPIFDGIDYVLHLAAESRIQIAIENPLLAVKTNSFGTATVLQCSREAKIKRLVYSSTSSAYGLNSFPNNEDQLDNCLNPYSVSKVSGEKLCTIYNDLFNLETVILRYFNVYGPRNPSKGQYAPVISIFKRQKDNDEPLTIVGDGEQRRDFTHVNDVINANILAATKDIDKEFLGTVFNIGTGKNYSINEIAKMFNHKSINMPNRLGESKITLADNSKAKNILGWTPSVDIKDWIKNNI
jgi:UDP-glucose 4-epimerase